MQPPEPRPGGLPSSASSMRAPSARCGITRPTSGIPRANAPRRQASPVPAHSAPKTPGRGDGGRNAMLPHAAPSLTLRSGPRLLRRRYDTGHSAGHRQDDTGHSHYESRARPGAPTSGQRSPQAPGPGHRNDGASHRSAAAGQPTLPDPSHATTGTGGAAPAWVSPRNLEGSLMREAVRWPIRGVSLIRSSRLALCGS